MNEESFLVSHVFTAIDEIKEKELQIKDLAACAVGEVQIRGRTVFGRCVCYLKEP